MPKTLEDLLAMSNEELEHFADPGGDLLQTATLQPAVDFGRLEQVFVMMRRGPTMDLLYDSERAEPVESARGPSRGRPSS